MKKTFVFILAVLLILAAAVPPVFASSSSPQTGDTDALAEDTSEETYPQDYIPTVNYYIGQVLLVEKVNYLEDISLDYNLVRQTCEVKIISGPFKDRVYTIVNTVDSTDPKSLDLNVGDKVMLCVEMTEDDTEISNIYIDDYYRVNYVMILFGVTMLVLLAVSLFRGLKMLVNITAFLASFAFIFIPLFFRGVSPALIMVPVCALFAFANVMVEIHFGERGWYTFLSVAVALGVTALVAYIGEMLCHTYGLNETEITMLMYSNQHIKFDLSGLNIALSMLVALGAAIDVNIYISEYMESYKTNAPYMSRMDLFSYGMEVGREALDRDVLTLMFASFATIIPSWVVYSSYSTPLMQLLNMDIVAGQLVRLLSGIIGVAVSVPLNCWIHSLVLKGRSLY